MCERKGWGERRCGELEREITQLQGKKPGLKSSYFNSYFSAHRLKGMKLGKFFEF